MGVILDTSALIGLFELPDDGPRILHAVREHGGQDWPAVHAVSLGELWAGVFKAEKEHGVASAEAIARRRTLVRASRPAEPGVGGFRLLTNLDVEEFGRISTVTGRRVGQNDRWILAAAIANDLTLITQDALLANGAHEVPTARVVLVEMAA